MKVLIYSREAIEHGYSDLRIEQILSKSHRNLSRYIASGMRR